MCTGWRGIQARWGSRRERTWRGHSCHGAAVLAPLEAASGEGKGSLPALSFILPFQMLFLHLRHRAESWGSLLGIQFCPVQAPLMPTYSVPPFLAGQACVWLSISTFTPGQSLWLRPTEPSPAQAGRRGTCPPPPPPPPS